MHRILLLCLLALFANTARAQFNQQWVTYTKDNSKLSAGTISDINNETDLAWGDLDKDGFVDLVVVRKEPFTSTGRRTNILLMNVNGVLTDKTSQFATASDVGGDQGFLTPTNDRDVVIDDFNQDGWDDFVTATTLSDGQPKHIGHPRVYMNRKKSGSAWLGVRFENSRIPQFFHFGNGSAQNPRFCAVASGDVTGNGYPDLYFGDYDSSGAGGAQQSSNQDLNDRLLINDGNGFFSDQSQARMTSTMLNSAFGNSVVVADFNGDGHNDIIKDTALNPPQNVSASYNNPANVGTFNVHHVFHNEAPYHTSAGDLNRDGRLDLVISDDFDDRVRYNTGTDALGRAIWSSAKTFNFLVGGDDGFASNNLMVDLNGDGWNDVLICDVDVDIGGYNRRLHIYHNRTGSIGSTNLSLTEERQSSGSGWVGVVGMTTSNMTGTHDVAAFDIDDDCDIDLVVSRKDGTDVWINQTNPANCHPVVCQTDLGFASGPARIDVCGGDLTPGHAATMTISQLPSSSIGFLLVGLVNNPTFVFDVGGTLVPLPYLFAAALPTGSGSIVLPVAGGFGPLTLYTQFVASTGPGTYTLTNAVKIDWP